MVTHWKFGWGGRIRTSEWRNQNPLPYHLATPQTLPGRHHRADGGGIQAFRWAAVLSYFAGRIQVP